LPIYSRDPTFHRFVLLPSVAAKIIWSLTHSVPAKRLAVSPAFSKNLKAPVLTTLPPSGGARHQSSWPFPEASVLQKNSRYLPSGDQIGCATHGTSVCRSLGRPSGGRDDGDLRGTVLRAADRVRDPIAVG